MRNQPRNLRLKPARPRAPLYYKRVLDELEKLDLKLAGDIQDLDPEITLLRVKIRSLSARDPCNFRTVTEAINALTRLIELRQKLARESGSGLKDAVTNILKDIAVPLGVATITKKL
jgi:hypothetical protein